MIAIKHYNNIYCEIECEPDIAQELSEFFTFSVPGAEFSPAFKSRHWDGKIRLFNLKKRLIYSGLVNHIIEFAKINGYVCVDHTWYIGKTPINSKFISTLKMGVEPRDYQLLAFAHAMRRKRAVVVSPTASGKSLMIYMMIRQLFHSGKKQGLLIVPTVSLVEQMYTDFQSYGWNVEKYAQRIYAGKSRIPDAPLIISTWQSLYEMPPSYFEEFDFVIGDEAHTFKAKSLTTIMNSLVNCDVRIGTTGTLDGTVVNKLVLEGLFGPVKQITTTKDLIDQGHLSEFEIDCLVLKYPENIRKLVKGMAYNDEIVFLIGNEQRNKFITNHVEKLHGNTLVLYTRVDQHGKILYDMLKDLPRKTFFISGDTPALDRENVRHITESEQDAIIVASYGTFSTGINIRNLHNIVFASPTKSRIRTLQSIGRGLRKGDNKDKAKLIDISDDLRHNTYINFTLKHMQERVKYYTGEKFPFKINSVELYKE